MRPLHRVTIFQFDSKKNKLLIIYTVVNWNISVKYMHRIYTAESRTRYMYFYRKFSILVIELLNNWLHRDFLPNDCGASAPLSSYMMRVFYVRFHKCCCKWRSIILFIKYVVCFVLQQFSTSSKFNDFIYYKCGCYIIILVKYESSRKVTWSK